ncbi:MAG: Rod shape-determining protein RodA [uncultured bacterium]|nr:MAG: Rod shape-determining protein RodA [uncultured bacterium]
MNIRFLKKFDWLMLISVVLLLFLGVLMIFSATLGETGVDRGNTYRQVVYIAIGLGFMFFLSFFDYRVFKNYSGVIYILMLAALVGVLIFGAVIRGTRGWFDLGVINIQPAEFAKFVCIIVLAKYFSKYKDEMYYFKHVLISGFYVLVPVVLILLEPDLGSALILVLIWLGMIFMSGIRYWHIGAILGGLALFSLAAWRFFLKDYQKERFQVFVDPSSDPLGRGYNVTQAKIAIGSGGIYGKGLGHGSQSQLKFLPEQHTDFVFAVLAEELGFVGCLFLFVAFGFLFYRIVRIAQLARDNFGMMLCVGVAVLILSQLFVNIGMNIGIVPVAGIPLPFLSFGGSSIVTILLCIGLVQNVAIRRRSA